MINKLMYVGIGVGATLTVGLGVKLIQKFGLVGKAKVKGASLKAKLTPKKKAEAPAEAAVA